MKNSIIKLICFLMINSFTNAATAKTEIVPAPQIFTNAALGQNKDSPILLQPDAFPRKKNKLSQKSSYGQELSKNILDSYIFLGEFDEMERPKFPPNWISVEKEPMRALMSGDLFQFGHSKINMIFPLVKLPKITYITGNEEITLHINTAIENWTAGRFKIAYDNFDNAIEEIKTKKLPKNKLEVVLTWVLRGYFLLDMEHRGEVLVGSKAEGYIPKELSRVDLLALTRYSFRMAMSKINIDDIISSMNADVDEELMASIFTCPFFEEDLDPSSTCPTKLVNRNLDPLLLLRSLGASIYWNLGVLQRVSLLWDDSFTALENMDSLFDKLDKRYLSEEFWPLSDKSPVIPQKSAIISAPIRIWPHIPKDIMASGLLVRSHAMLATKDPLEIIRYADYAIKKASSAELSAIGFLLAGTTYFDLNNFTWARKSFSWCEGISYEFSQKYPYCIFFGAESAFWEGKYEVAKPAFNAALNLTGDQLYGPWMRFRLGNIAQQNNLEQDAQIYYAEMMRVFPDHLLYSDALTRIYCNQIFAREFNEENREKMFAKVNKAIENSRVELKLQAKTCMLMSELQETYDTTGEKVATITTDALSQLKLMQTYQKDFPQSKYSALFADRIAKLDLSFVQDYANRNECKDLLNAYSTQNKVLNGLKDLGKQYLRTLEWGSKERIVVLRCAALENNLDIWKALRETDAGQNGKKIQDSLYEFEKSGEKIAKIGPLIKNVINLIGTKDWDLAATKIDFLGKNLVTSDSFWNNLAVETVLKANLKASTKEKQQITSSMFSLLKKSPLTILESDTACTWLLSEKNRLTPSMLDTLAKAQKPQFWLDLLLAKNKSTSIISQCNTELSTKMLNTFMKNGSKFRDEFLIIPYLQAKGVSGSEDSWLIFLANRERQEGRSKKISEYYAKLEKESKDPRIKDIAKAWKEKEESN